jgi:hypothetical protein
VCGDHALDEISVRDIADEQRHAFREKLREAGREIVDDDNAFARIDQRANRVAADMPAPPVTKIVIAFNALLVPLAPYLRELGAECGANLLLEACRNDGNGV